MRRNTKTIHFSSDVRNESKSFLVRIPSTFTYHHYMKFLCVFDTAKIILHFSLLFPFPIHSNVDIVEAKPISLCENGF